MLCNIADFRNKQVVSVITGMVIGYVNDIEIDTETGEISNIVIFGKTKYLGFLGKEDDIIIPFKNIKVIGAETILVDGPINFKK